MSETGGSLKEQNFQCTRCGTKFRALAGEHEAPACPKCADSEFIERAYLGYITDHDT